MPRSRGLPPGGQGPGRPLGGVGRVLLDADLRSSRNVLRDLQNQANANGQTAGTNYNNITQILNEGAGLFVSGVDSGSLPVRYFAMELAALGFILSFDPVTQIVTLTPQAIDSGDLG